jgi:tetratricopeptide (TPR) repeat protein
MRIRSTGGGLSVALLLLSCAAANFAQNAAAGGGQANVSAPAPVSVAADPTVSQGLAALQANQARQALAIFQKILQLDPNNTTANLLASTAAVELFQGPLAVQFAEKAEHLDPRNWKIHTTLVAAYSAAGMKPQRDRERALLEQMHRSGAPDARLATGFLLEMFPLGGHRVDAIEYFEPMGRFHTYYRFLVRQADGKRIWEVDVESNEFDQKSWAEAHPGEAAAGERQFQITGRGDGGNSIDYRMFSGKPDYDNIRVMVVEILRTRLIPGTQSAAAH